jgi:hypothetical protein
LNFAHRVGDLTARYRRVLKTAKQSLELRRRVNRRAVDFDTDDMNRRSCFDRGFGRFLNAGRGDRWLRRWLNARDG